MAVIMDTSPIVFTVSVQRSEVTAVMTTIMDNDLFQLGKVQLQLV